MNNTSLKNKALTIIQSIIKAYPDAKIELSYDHKDPWQLLVVVALSAQTTDKKVNQISPTLFKRFTKVTDFAKVSGEDIEPYIKTLGLYRNKAKHLALAARQIINNFAGHVPKDRQSLESIAGVGKKTAAVIIANAFNIPAIAVDTHVSRIAQRLGLTKEKNPDKIEIELTKLLPKHLLLKAHHAMIIHGRRVCLARKPRCEKCVVSNLCPRIGLAF